MVHFPSWGQWRVIVITLRAEPLPNGMVLQGDSFNYDKKNQVWENNDQAVLHTKLQTTDKQQ